MNNEETVIKFITTTVVSLQKQIDKLKSRYKDNPMLESACIDTYLTTWYKHALDEAPIMASNLNYSIPNTIDLLAGIVNLTYEIYFGLDYEEFLPLYNNSPFIINLLKKGREKLNSKDIHEILCDKMGWNEEQRRQYRQLFYTEPRKSCYIATMAYQDINHPQVEYLRTIRDTKLSDYALGRSFIKYYYMYSPNIVKRLQNHKKINKAIKTILDILIIFLKRIIKTN